MTTELTEKKIDIYSVIVRNPLASEPSETKPYESLINEILAISTTHGLIKKVSEQFLLQLLHNEKKSFHKLLSAKLNILKFTCTLRVNSSPKIKSLSDSLVQLLSEEQTINSLYCFMTDLVTCANILAPGILSIKEYYVFIDNQLYRTVEHFDIFNSIYNFEFPPLKNTRLVDIYNWLEKAEKNNGYSTTKLGKAIGALNRLIFSNLEEGEAMMWLIVALEALYNNPKEINEISIRKQIVEKSKIITGSSINEKYLKDMYQARSDFFHGKTNFKIYSSIYDLSYIKRESFMENHLNTALELLFKTLQYMVKHNNNDLEFERIYRLK